MSKKQNSKNKNKNKKKNNNNKAKRQKQAPVLWYQNLGDTLKISNVKTFFSEQITRVSNSLEKAKFKYGLKGIVDQSKTYITKNRNSIAFFSVLALIVTVGYVAIVLPDDKVEPVAETISIDMNEETNDFMDTVENEIGDIQLPEKNDGDQIVVDLNTDEIPVAEPITEITSSDLTEPVEVETSEASEIVDTTTYKAATSSAFDSVEDSMKIGIDMYAILVDGKPVAYFGTEGEALMLLKDLKEKYMADDAVEERVIFSEDISVEVVKRDVLDFDGFRTKDEVMEYIIKGTNEQKIHTVVEGENFWVIAARNELNVQDLLDANPDIDERRLQIGTELSLIVAEPIINVVTISTIERVDEVPYARGEDILTDNYYEGEYKTKQAGVPGEALNTVEIYMENGKIIGEKVLSSEVRKEPVELIVYKGTKPAPPRIGSGTYSNPTSRGYITSYFGSRSLGYHNGIDIGVPMHTDVKAADGGTVIFAGYKGTYGKLVMINHGANTVSYYAHNDVLKVSAGESVFKGQLIALSGSTGRSTGPHLHFEVRINGSPVNPIKYVSY